MANETPILEKLDPVDITKKLEGRKLKFRLKRRLSVRLERTEFGFEASHPKLPCFGTGETVEEAVAGFQRTFEMVWRFMENATPDAMGPNAREMRRRMRAYAEMIVDEEGAADA